MSKITLTDLANLQNETTTVNAINANNAILETASTNTLSRDGTSPNQMGAVLDMNSNRIINLPNAINGSEPATKAQLDAIGNGYLGNNVLLGTNNEISISSGGGTSTFSLPPNLTFTGKTITGGTFAAPTLSGSSDATTKKYIADAVGIYNASDYGVSATNPDNGPALNALIATVNALSGGVIQLPYGVLTFSTPVNLNFCQDVVLRGKCGPQFGIGTGTMMIYSGVAGALPFIQMNSAIACKLEYLTLYSNGAGFDGYIVQCNASSNNPTFCRLEYCGLGSLNSHLVVGVSLKNCESFAINRCNFGSLLQSVQGLVLVGDFSGNTEIKNCNFTNGFGGQYIYAPGTNWIIDNCVFEGSAAGTAIGVASPLGLPFGNLTITNCWCGDITAGGNFFEFSGISLTFTGNVVAGSATSNGLVLNNVDSAVIKGNYLYGLNFGIAASGTCTDFDVSGNTYNVVTTPLSGIPGYGQYHYLSNGMIMQYGSATVTIGVPLAVTFPKVMTAAPVSVQLTQKDATGTGNIVYVNGAPSTTGFTISALGTAGSETVYWTAIGNVH